MTDDLHPNVVLMVGDNGGWGDVGCYGGLVPTPRLDALAAECAAQELLRRGAVHAKALGSADRSAADPHRTIPAAALSDQLVAAIDWLPTLACAWLARVPAFPRTARSTASMSGHRWEGTARPADATMSSISVLMALRCRSCGGR